MAENFYLLKLRDNSLPCHDILNYMVHFLWLQQASFQFDFGYLPFEEIKLCPVWWKLEYRGFSRAVTCAFASGISTARSYDDNFLNDESFDLKGECQSMKHWEGQQFSTWDRSKSENHFFRNRTWHLQGENKPYILWKWHQWHGNKAID